MHVHKNTSAGAPSVLLISQAALKSLELSPLDFHSTRHHATDTGASIAGESRQLPAQY